MGETQGHVVPATSACQALVSYEIGLIATQSSLSPEALACSPGAPGSRDGLELAWMPECEIQAAQRLISAHTASVLGGEKTGIPQAEGIPASASRVSHRILARSSFLLCVMRIIMLSLPTP